MKVAIGITNVAITYLLSKLFSGNAINIMSAQDASVTVNTYF